MSDTTTNNQAALEAARRAQEQARQAAERQRQLAAMREKVKAEQARKIEAGAQDESTAANATEAAKQAPVDKDTFVNHATFAGTDAAKREAIFDKYDKDGTAGLSDEELDAAFAEASPEAELAVPQRKVSEDVGDELRNAMKDDTDTEEDLLDAAGESRTPDDVHEIMAHAEARGVDQEKVLQALLRERDEKADHPDTAMYEAIAQHYDRLGKGDHAATVRAAGDPGVSKDVRKELVHALHDRTDTGEDLRDAANASRNPKDLAAVMRAQRATNAEKPEELLRQAIEGLDEKAERPNSDLMNAIAGEYEKLGDGKRAEAMRLAADPALTKDVRKELIHALQDDTDTAEDIDDALDEAKSAADLAATQATGGATIGGQHTDQLVAQKEIEGAQKKLEDAQEKAKKATETLQVALAKSDGAMTPEQQQAFMEKFKAKHPEIGAVEQAEKELAGVVAKHQDAIGGALERGEQLGEMDAGKLEDALAVAAKHPEGVKAASAIAVKVLNNAEKVPDERLEMLMEKVLPQVRETELQEAIKRHPNDPKKAAEEFENTPLGQAMANVKGSSETIGKIRQHGLDMRNLAQAVQAGDASAAADIVERNAQGAKADKFCAAIAGMGVAFGAVAFATSKDWTSRTKAALETGSAAADVAAAAARNLGKLGALAALEKAGPILGSVASAISGIMNLKDGKYVEAAADGAMVALGVIAVTTSIPGVNLAAGLIAGGILVFKAWQANKEAKAQEQEIRELFGEVGLEQGKIDFLVDGDPGAYKDAKANLGLTGAQIDDLVKAPSTWAKNLDEIKDPAFKAQVLPKLVPSGRPEDLVAKLKQLERDFSPEAQAYVVKMLGDTAGLYENKQASNLPDYQKGTLESTYRDLVANDPTPVPFRGDEIDEVYGFLDGVLAGK